MCFNFWPRGEGGGGGRGKRTKKEETNQEERREKRLRSLYVNRVVCSPTAVGPFESAEEKNSGNSTILILEE